MMGVYVGIDHGGSLTTAVVVSDNGLILSRGSEPTKRSTPHAGWVEHRPDDFVDSSLAAAHKALAAANLSWRDVAALGIANQGETSFAWDTYSRRPVGPALSWQDKRTAERCDQLRALGHGETVERISGLSIDPYFSAAKYAWLSNSSDEARLARERGSLRLGGTDAYLIDALTGGATHATDPSSVSRTALMNLETGTWSPELLDLFDVPANALPSIQPTTSHFGVIDHPDIGATGIPIAADIVDTNSSQYLHELWHPGAVKATLGTGAFIETSVGNQPKRPDNGLAPFIGWSVGDDLRYVLEGSVYDVGAAIDWGVSLGLMPSAAGTSELAQQVPDAAGVTFVPAFSGLAAPHWNSDARASISGLSLKAGPAHIARAMLEGIALAVSEAITLLREAAGHDEVTVKVDGGPSQNPFLMGLLADFLGYPVIATQEPDITGFGAALLAGMSVGHFSRADIVRLDLETVTYEPQSNTAFREAKREEWLRSVEWVIGGNRPRI
ncbi:FGGY family carbohydrate kinase [Streptomyces hirsutus]|uniref:FGGY family carbohydrate kinase n=1 Tax=Streptomyces hirsutus TaxID=35620 RepID=UPI00364DAA33